jgi:hypothetical protein
MDRSDGCSPQLYVEKCNGRFIDGGKSMRLALSPFFLRVISARPMPSPTRERRNGLTLPPGLDSLTAHSHLGTPTTRRRDTETRGAAIE